MDHDVSNTLPASLAPADAGAQAELEAYQIQAAQKLHAAIEAHRQIEKAILATAVDLEALTASSWAELPIAYDDLAHALILTDLATIGRKGWRQSVKKAEARQPGSSLDAYDILADVVEAQDADEMLAGSNKKLKADQIATVLEVRGDVLRVAAGNNTLRCWIDIPLHLDPSTVAYRSAPFRVTSLNLYKLVVGLGREIARDNLGTVFNLRYNPVEGTLAIPYKEGPISLAAQRLLRRHAETEADEMALPATSFDAKVLASALAYVRISVPAKNQGGSSPFAEVKNGRAIGSRPSSISVYTHAGLNDLVLFIEQTHLTSVIDILKKFVGPAEVRTTPSHELFSDGCLMLRVARMERNALSGINRMLDQIREQPGPELRLPHEDVARCLLRSMFHGLFRRSDRLTQIKLDRIPTDYELPAQLDPNIVEVLAASAVAEIKAADFDPDNEWSALIETGKTPADPEADATALQSDFSLPDPGTIASAPLEVAQVPADVADPSDGSEYPATSLASAPEVPSEDADITAAAPTDPLEQTPEPLASLETGPPQEPERPLQLVLKFLTPNTAPSAGWTPFWVSVIDVTDFDAEPDWLMAGQLFDIRQFAKAVRFDRTAKPIRLRLVERRLLLQDTIEGGDAITILASETGVEFGSTKMLVADW